MITTRLLGILRRQARDRRGQALVEFALILPLLLLIVIGVWEFGRAWNTYQVITDAAREGVRIAVIENTRAPNGDSIVTNAIHQQLWSAALDTTLVTVQTTGWQAGRGTPATVRIQYPYRFPIVGTLLGWTTGTGGRVVLKTLVTMRNE